MSSPEHEKYPWYEVVEGPQVLQGDLLDGCFVLVPSADASLEEPDIEGDILEHNAIVMSQSCDLRFDKLELVLICPVYNYAEHSEKEGNQHLKVSRIKEEIRQGLQPGYHMLAKCDIAEWERPIRLVDFRNVYSLPISYLKAFAAKRSPRLRLMPPYREHLAQSFARFFMRVGLPIDVEF